MAESVRAIMASHPVMLEAGRTLAEASREMRDKDVGDILVTDASGDLLGILTDRDVVVRGLAEGVDPELTHVGDICSRELYTVEADATVDEVVTLMRDRAVRRVPVVDHGRPVGVVSIGGLAARLDPTSVLGHISAAHPTR